MVSDKEALKLYNDASDEVRNMVERMILVVENENPKYVLNDDAIEIAAGWEISRYREMLKEAKEIVRLDIRNIRSHD